MQERTPWREMFDTGRDLYTFDGALVMYSDKDYYIGDFDDRDRSVYIIKPEENKVTKEPESTLEKNIEAHEINNSEENKEEHVNPFDGMIDNYPKLPMYNVDELFDCVRISPKDIGKLDIGNWKLGSNSFLTHGYYTYKYLMLGRMRFDDGNKRAVLGVPGVYSNREKYLANMFGFNTFIPVKKIGQKTGQFGYWIVEVDC